MLNPKKNALFSYSNEENWVKSEKRDIFRACEILRECGKIEQFLHRKQWWKRSLYLIKKCSTAIQIISF